MIGPLVIWLLCRIIETCPNSTAMSGFRPIPASSDRCRGSFLRMLGNNPRKDGEFQLLAPSCHVDGVEEYIYIYIY